MRKFKSDLKAQIKKEREALNKEVTQKMKRFTLLKAYGEMEKIYKKGNVLNKNVKLKFLRRLIKRNKT